MSAPRGYFIVAEGVDGTGKTTALRQVARFLTGSVIYRAGFPRDSRWRRFINRHPSSFAYYLDFVVQTWQIKRLVSCGKIVLQDRYIQSVDSFLPDARYKFNRVVRWLVQPFLLKPDLYIWFTADPTVIQKRLAEKCRSAPDSYDALLACDAAKISARDREYRNIFNTSTGQKLLVDTSVADPESAVLTVITHLKHIVCS